jgi:hypothetical protein
MSMARHVLQVNFKFNIPRADYENAAAEMADSFAEVPGLRWKIWLMNGAESEAGGIYLFDDEASLKSYLESPLAAQVKSHPAFSEMSVKQFKVLDAPTATDRGPV